MLPFNSVIRTSTVNSNKSGPASKLSLSPIKANAKVADDDTAADGLKKKAAADSTEEMDETSEVIGRLLLRSYDIFE
jgi:hypothetical protein